MAQIDFLGDPIFQAVDGNGVPYAGGLVWCYDAESDDPRTMYTTIQDAINGTNPVGNKVVLDSAGRYPIVYAGPSKFVLEDANINPDTGHGNVIWTADNIGRFGNTVIDPYGNIIVEYDYQANSGNYFSITNAPSGQNPTIAAKGVDAQVGITLQVKGSSKGVTVKSDSSQYTLPPADGASGQFLGTDGAGNITFQTPPGISQVIPPGTIMDFGAATPPPGFLACNGSAVSRSTYAALFAAIGTTWGSGDGVNTFNLPGLQGYVRMGAGGTIYASMGGNTVGVRGGEATHALTINEMPNHNHTVSSFPVNAASYGAGGGTAAINIGNTAVTSSTGAGVAHNNIQPSAICLVIIKT